MTRNTDVPVNFVRFDPSSPIEQVRYWAQGTRMTAIISSKELWKMFQGYGLKMNEMPAQKSINDKSSSPYHDWQRVHMGNSVVVADIDLLRLENGVPTEIIELKRSFIDIEKWEPYQKDYRNFCLIPKLARKRGLDFYIVYNYRRKEPLLDDVSLLKIFEFDHRSQSRCKFLGFRTIQQFAEPETNMED